MNYCRISRNSLTHQNDWGAASSLVDKCAANVNLNISKYFRKPTSRQIILMVSPFFMFEIVWSRPIGISSIRFHTKFEVSVIWVLSSFQFVYFILKLQSKALNPNSKALKRMYYDSLGFWSIKMSSNVYWLISREAFDSNIRWICLGL